MFFTAVYKIVLFYTENSSENKKMKGKNLSLKILYKFLRKILMEQEVIKNS